MKRWPQWQQRVIFRAIHHSGGHKDSFSRDLYLGEVSGGSNSGFQGRGFHGQQVPLSANLSLTPSALRALNWCIMLESRIHVTVARKGEQQDRVG